MILQTDCRDKNTKRKKLKSCPAQDLDLSVKGDSELLPLGSKTLTKAAWGRKVF